jgi:predicted kinase
MSSNLIDIHKKLVQAGETTLSFSEWKDLFESDQDVQEYTHAHLSNRGIADSDINVWSKSLFIDSSNSQSVRTEKLPWEKTADKLKAGREASENGEEIVKTQETFDYSKWNIPSEERKRLEEMDKNSEEYPYQDGQNFLANFKSLDRPNIHNPEDRIHFEKTWNPVDVDGYLVAQEVLKKPVIDPWTIEIPTRPSTSEVVGTIYNIRDGVDYKHPKVLDKLAEQYFNLDGFVRERVEGKKSGIGEGAWIARKFDNMVQGLIGEPKEKYYKNSEEYDLENFFKDSDGGDEKYKHYTEYLKTGVFNTDWVPGGDVDQVISDVRNEEQQQFIERISDRVTFDFRTKEFGDHEDLLKDVKKITEHRDAFEILKGEPKLIAEFAEAIRIDEENQEKIDAAGSIDLSYKINAMQTNQEIFNLSGKGSSAKEKFWKNYFDSRIETYKNDREVFEEDAAAQQAVLNKYKPDYDRLNILIEALGVVNEYSSPDKIKEYVSISKELDSIISKYKKELSDKDINILNLDRTQRDLKSRSEILTKNYNLANDMLITSKALALDYNDWNRAALRMEMSINDIAGYAALGLKHTAKLSDRIVETGNLLLSERKVSSNQLGRIWKDKDDTPGFKVGGGGNRALTDYWNNQHNASINYGESLQQHEQTQIPLTMDWSDVNMNNIIDFTGQVFANNSFSIGTALTYGGFIKAGMNVPKATAALSTTFFAVEAGGRLSRFELEQKNAPKAIEQLSNDLIKAVTEDERSSILKQIEYHKNALSASEIEKAFSSTLYGLGAAYAERLGTMRIMRNLMRGTPTNGRLSLANFLKGTYSVGKGIGVEYTEEFFTQVFHNLVDNTVSGHNKSLVDGVDANFNANVIMSSMAIMAPSVSTNVYNSIRSELLTQGEISKNKQRAKDLAILSVQLHNDKLSGGKLLEQDTRDYLISKVDAILREAALVDSYTFADIANLTSAEVKEIFSNNQKKRDKLNEIRNLGSQSSYERSGDNYIKQQKEKLTNEIYELNGKRDQLRDKPRGRRIEKIKETIKKKDQIKVDTEFYLGKFHGNMNIVKGLAGKTKTFGKINTESNDPFVDLTDLEKYLDKKVEKRVITKWQRDGYLKGFRKGNYASFIGNEIIVVEPNVILGINNAETALAKSMISYAPLHELQHIYDISSGLIVDNEVIESQAVVVQNIETELQSLYDQGKITEEDYTLIRNRINVYSIDKNGELRDKAALSKFGKRFKDLNEAQQDEMLKTYPKKVSVDLMELLTIAGELKNAGILKENSTDLLLSLKLMLNGLSNRYFKKGAMFFKLNSTSDVLGYIDSFQRSTRNQTLILGPEEEAKNAKFSSALESINNLIPSDVKTKEDYQEFVRDRKRFAPLGKALEENGIISNYVKSKSVGDEYVDAMESVTDRVIGLRGIFNPERLRKDGTKVGKEAFGEFIFANTNFAKRDAKKALAIRKIESDKTTSIDTKEVREIEDQSTINESTSGRSDSGTKKTNVLNFTGVSSKINELMDVVDIMPVGSNTFKTVDEYTGKAAEIIFDIPAEKATKGNKNLSHKTKVVNGMMELSQAGKIQDFFRVGDNLEKLVKIMVPENVTSKTADISEVGENIDVARDIYGRSIGLKGKVLEYFFDKTGKRSQGLTTQPNVWELKPEFKNPSKETLDKLRSDLGITPQGQANVSDRAFNGQLLKGVAEYQAYQTALSITQRKLDAIKQEATTKEEKSAISQDIANVTAAQSKAAFSAAIKLRDADSFKATYQVTLEQLSDMIGYKLAALTTVGRINSKGEEDSYQTRNLGAQLVIYGKETGETIKQGGIRVVSDFLNINPEFRGLLRTTLTGGETKSGGFFLTTEVFDELFPATDVEQIAGREKYTTSEYTPGGFNQKYLETYDSLDENKKLDALYDFFKAVEEHLKGKPNNAWFFLELIRDTSKHQNTLTRVLAPFGFWPVYKDGNVVIDEKVTEEHTDPQNLIGKSGLAGAIFGEVDFVFKVIRQSYMQGPLLNSKKFPHDKIVNAAGFMQSMPNIYYEKIVPRILSEELNLPSGYASIVRLAYAVHPKTGQRIDLNMYMLGEAGMTITQYFGVDGISDIAVQNKLIVDFLAGDVTRGEIDAMKKVPFSKNIETGKKTSAAVSFSRTVNPAKGISVLDFDDTLATTKSGVRYTLPNPDGTPQPKKKVIFMAGGPGSGKSNVINQLGLKEQGFKVVNQDISLEWLMKNHGMPTDMREFTPEQASEFGKLSAQAREIALKKRIKYQGEGDGVVIDGTGASLNVMKKNIQDFKDKGYDVQMIFVETSQETALSRNKARKERSLRTGIVIKNYDSVQANKEAYKELFGERFAEVNTDNLKQGDVMPADVVNKVNDFTSGYIKGRLNAGEYATKGEELRQQGAEFDFSEFNQVVEGKTAPLFNKAMKLQEKFTSKDMFVLTARPAESNRAIFEFLQANGLNIPMENIIGLGSSLSSDKALWMAGKVGEGYNDFYFRR